MVLVGLALVLATLSVLLCRRYPLPALFLPRRSPPLPPPPPPSPTLTLHLPSLVADAADAAHAAHASDAMKSRVDSDIDVDIDPHHPSLDPAANSPQRASPPHSRSTAMLPPPAPPRAAGRLSAPPLSPPSSSSLAPPPTSSLKPPKPRQKVVLAPGHSPLDWARLQQSGAHLSGRADPLGPLLRIPPSQLRLHNRRADAWSQFGARVYNITPYLAFHPGGEAELMRAAGRDGTHLFVQAHAWVSWENMLENCLVGLAVPEHASPSSRWSEMD
ncbi:MAG: hypothetical protein M1829_001186 [Trizodia sp. TS-e1964]|nr:MAG: hypothetical protein M1829_001186 [Trizodia sp. TS-e1964]